MEEASTLLDIPRLTEPTFDLNAGTISSWKMDYCTTEKDYFCIFMIRKKIVRLNIASLGMDVSLLVSLLYLNIISFKSETCSGVYSYVSIFNNFKEKLLLPRC